jgi:6-phosphogluconate dehydrogenase
MSDYCDVGIFGLATMGANLARNAARRGYKVAVYNRHAERTDQLIQKFGSEGSFVPSSDVGGFVASLTKPRAVVLVVEAGAAIDRILDDLMPLLDPGDVVIDAGNSLFSDTERRAALASTRGLHFMGMGMSGGEKGALHGPSLMPGGDRGAYERLAPMLEKLAATAEGEPCCAYIGPGGSGHYVKMVHNGIEYADMQAMAEVYDLLRTSYRLSAGDVADVFDRWRGGELDSFLLDIAVDVLRRQTDDGTPLIDLVIDEAEQKGTGRWTARDALVLGVVSSSTVEAVNARVVSAGRDLRTRGSELLKGAGTRIRELDDVGRRDVHDALMAARLVAFSQNFDQLAAASAEHGWHLDLGRIAAIWRGGCIIRGRVLDHIVDARGDGEHREPLLFVPWFRDAIAIAEPGWRRFVSAAIADGVPVPVISSALAYYDGLREKRSPANLIQGLRDEFGAHGYRRFDRDGECHTDWSLTGTDPQ